MESGIINFHVSINCLLSVGLVTLYTRLGSDTFTRQSWNCLMLINRKARVVEKKTKVVQKTDNTF